MIRPSAVLLALFFSANLPAFAQNKKGPLADLPRQPGAHIEKIKALGGRFNGGEKVWFWLGVVVLGLIVSASGFVLDMLVPGIIYSRGNMQIANVIHLTAAVLVTAMSLGHIYLGTIGMEGAYAAMRHGYVDETWAKEHHELWYEDIESGKVPRVRTQEGANRVGTPVKAV